MNNQTKKRLKRGLIGFFVLALLATFWEAIPLTRHWERATLDFRYSHFNRTTKAGPQVVFIDIDEQSLKLLSQSYGRWPWPRRVYKELIEFLSVGEPAGIFFDIYFTEPQQGTDDDALLAQASALGKGLGAHAMNLLVDPAEEREGINPLPADFGGRFALRFESGQAWTGNAIAQFRDYLLPNPTLYQATKRIHVTSFEKDSDGVFRRAPVIFQYGDQWLPSLSLLGVMSTLPDPKLKMIDRHTLAIAGSDGRSYRVRLDDRATMPIHYYRSESGPERIPFAAVIASALQMQKGEVSDPSQLKVNPLDFQNKVVIVGGSAAGLEDLKATPIHPAYPGPILHATAVANILQHDFLIEASLLVRILVGILMIATAYASVLFLGPIGLKVGVPIGMLLIYNAVAIGLFQGRSLWLDMAMPSLTVLFAVFDGLAYVSFVEGTERKRIKSALIKYVSPSVAEAMVESGQNPSAEVGRIEELTILFSDIRGFTTMSEKYEPAFLVEWLNQYLGKMTGLIFHSDGTLDKFIGDAVMAFWGAPVRQEDHAVRAISTAFAMRRALNDLLKEWDTRYQGRVKIAAGVGINSGKVVVGNIGSDMRLDYTVIGDNVNLASRVEGLTKQYHLNLLVGARTEELARNAFVFRKVDCVQVKGKTSGVFLYEPLAEKAASPDNEVSLMTELAQRFDDAWKDYETGRFEQALKKFETVRQWRGEDGPCEIFMERCKDLLQNPPKEWNGIYVAKNK